MDDFKNLDNAQNVEIIANIFANNKPISELKSDDPQCIILVGAPGVGKTTQTERYLSELGYDYNKFYNISLDAIVEKVKPYRNTTMRVYHALKDKKTNLNDTNFGILRHGIKWKGYKQKEFDRLSAEGSKLDGFLTPAEEAVYIASQTYLNAVGQVLPSVQTLATTYSQEPNGRKGWVGIHEAVKQINNIGEPEALVPYMATSLLRKAI